MNPENVIPKEAAALQDASTKSYDPLRHSSQRSQDLSPEQNAQLQQSIEKSWPNMSQDTKDLYGNRPQIYQNQIEKELLQAKPEEINEHYQQILQMLDGVYQQGR